MNSIIYFLNISLLIGCFPDHLDHLAQFGYDFLITAGGSRYFKSDVQKKQDDTRQSSNSSRTRTPSTHVITTWETNCDLKNMNFYETAVFRFLTLRLRINLEISIL